MDATPVRNDQTAADATAVHATSRLDGSHAGGLPPGASRSLLRFLLLGQGVGPGARVLDVGAGCSTWVRALRWLGISASGLGTVPADASAARSLCPEAEVRWTPHLSRVPWEPHAFDLVVVRDRPEWAGSLNGPTVRDALAALLSVVRPGGRLVVAQRMSHGKNAGATAHAPECHAQCFATFPGRTSTHFVADGISETGAWRWLFGFSARPGYLAAVHRVPALPIRAAEWSQQASAVLSTAPCCEYGARSTATETDSTAATRRRAA